MPIQRQPIQPHMLTGNSFLTTVHFPDEPDWAPLEKLARLVAQAPQLPQFHPMEFMYMAELRGDHRHVTIHLFKHIDTRRYVNLDNGGHAYAYRPRVGDPMTQYSGGRYRRYRSMVDALAALGLQAFDDSPPLFRSYPPEAWAS